MPSPADPRSGGRGKIRGPELTGLIGEGIGVGTPITLSRATTKTTGELRGRACRRRGDEEGQICP